MLTPIKVIGIYKTSVTMNNQTSHRRLDKYDSNSTNDRHSKNSSKSFKDILKEQK